MASDVTKNTQSAISTLEMHCRDKRISALVTPSVNRPDLLLVLVPNRKNHRAAVKVLGSTWQGHPLRILTYAEARLSRNVKG